MARLKLDEVLKKKKITKYRFAQLMGTDRSNASRYFREDYDPKFSTLLKIAKALGVGVKDLIEE